MGAHALSLSDLCAVCYFREDFSKYGERTTKAAAAAVVAVPAPVRNVKVHCFIEENGEKLFGRADAKLSNSCRRCATENFRKFRRERERASERNSAALYS